MLFRRFHENYKGCTAATHTSHNNESKPKQAPPVISHGRPWRSGKTVFNEMMAYINMHASLAFSPLFVFGVSIPVVLKFIFF